MKTLIFADVHLKVSEEGAPTREEFVRFLRAVDPAEIGRVVVAGDLFDFWFEYRHVVFSGYFEVLRAFAELRDAGVELHLVCGNHDFWAGRFLQDTLRFHVHPDSYLLEQDGTRVLFVHGDGLNSKDRIYRAYKRFARWKWVVALFGRLHPDWAMGFAQRVSRTSRTLQEGPPEHGRDVDSIRAYAESSLRADTADVVISGHTHHPDETVFDTPAGQGRYLNTGDWLEGRHYLVWDGETFRRGQYETGMKCL